MNEKIRTYLICASIIIAAIIIANSIYSGLGLIGQFIDHGLSVINQSLAQR